MDGIKRYDRYVFASAARRSRVLYLVIIICIKCIYKCYNLDRHATHVAREDGRHGIGISHPCSTLGASSRAAKGGDPGPLPCHYSLHKKRMYKCQNPDRHATHVAREDVCHGIGISHPCSTLGESSRTAKGGDPGSLPCHYSLHKKRMYKCQNLDRYATHVAREDVCHGSSISHPCSTLGASSRAAKGGAAIQGSLPCHYSLHKKRM